MNVLSVTVGARVSRKAAALPRFVVLPADAIASWRLRRTTVIDVRINDRPVSRRTLKPWTPDVLFLTITQADCDALGIDTGSHITLALSIADASPPDELQALLRSFPPARSAWEGLSQARQRMLLEHVASAKRPETRARRAAQALLTTPNSFPRRA